MQGNYYDIDDILAEEHTIPCRFTVKGVDLGYLNRNSHSDDLKKGSQLDLPFWLAKPLSERGYTQMGRPIYFSEKFADKLLVEPKAVNLRSKCDNWYRFGTKLSILLKNEEISQWMQHCLSQRNELIIDQSHYHRSEKYEIIKSKLTNVERELFEAKNETEKCMNQWKNDFMAFNKNKNKRSVLGKRKLSEI